MSQIEPEQSRTINWHLLGGIRFGLAMIVVLSHICMLWDRNTAYYARFAPLAAVAMFLVISGLSIAHSYSREQEGFYRRRFWRIAPLFWIGSALGFLPHILYGRIIAVDLGSAVEMPPWHAIITQFLGLNPMLGLYPAFNGALWSLSVEIVLYALTPLIARIPTRWLVVLIIASAALYVGLPLRPDAWVYPRMFWAFGLGWMLYHHWHDKRVITFALVLPTVILIPRAMRDELFGPLLALLVISAIIWGASLDLPARWNKPMEYLGDLSFPIYIVHSPLIGTMSVAGVGVGFTYPAMLGLTIFPAAAILLHLVDRPLRHLGRNQRKGPATLAAGPTVAIQAD